MSDLKTKRNNNSVSDYLNQLNDPLKKADCKAILQLMEEVTGEKAKMWGDSIVGFGEYHYKYPSGREGDWFLTGFAPRKQNLTIYIMSGFNKYDELMNKLGKYKTGKGCLYFKKLEDLNVDVLKVLVKESASFLANKYPAK